MELDAVIERRSRKGETTADDEDGAYLESVRRFTERARAERRQEWTEFHRSMAVLHGRLADEHREKAEKLCQSEVTEGAPA